MHKKIASIHYSVLLTCCSFCASPCLSVSVYGQAAAGPAVFCSFPSGWPHFYFRTPPPLPLFSSTHPRPFLRPRPPSPPPPLASLSKPRRPRVLHPQGDRLPRAQGLPRRSDHHALRAPTARPRLPPAPTAPQAPRAAPFNS